MTDATDTADELFVPSNWPARLLDAGMLFIGLAVFVGVVMTASPLAPFAFRLLIGVATLALTTFVGYRVVRHVGARLTPRAIRLERLFGSTEVPWDDLIALALPYSVGYRDTAGYFLVLVPAPGRGPWRSIPPKFDGIAAVELTRYVRDRIPDIVVDPVEPWQDRFGTWHGSMRTFDPEESIRSVRRAAVGRFEIRVVVNATPGQLPFIVVTTDEHGHRVRESAPLPDLAVATDEALAQVAAARDAP